MSTCYYALFHALCRTVADSLIGGRSADRSGPAWRQAYRAVEHGYAKNRCRDGTIEKFPKSIEDFASQFIRLQELRHSADYDPYSRFDRSEVRTLIGDAETAIEEFARAPIRDRRAFAAYVTLKSR